MLILSIKPNLNRLERDLGDLERRQIPFASATAVNSLAALVQNAERQAMESTFDGVTPFTKGGVKIKRARKSDPTAIIFLGDVAEQYLAPYISGGRHFLGGKRALLNPKNVNVNQYGNLPKGKLAALKGRSDVFVGTIKIKGGQTIGGVFQRGNFKVGGARRTKGVGKLGRAKIVGQRARLKILIRFTDSQEVRQKLPWYETARDIVSKHATRELDLAMKMALSTAKP